MITKDTTEYNDLYAKANKLLGYTESDEKYIKNIDMYFRNLKYISDAAQGDITYFMLPIEEPLFEINANTRNITIPNEFSHGIGVQGDEVAEIIFFSIDRYFDITDFYSDEIIPVVQWKYANQNHYNLSATFGKVLMEVPDKETGEKKVKVVFGWPIGKEVTENAGAIQFAVRFCSYIDAEGKLITNPADYTEDTLQYNFSTLNATTKINPSLDIKLEAGEYEYINKNNLIWNRMRNSPIVNLNLKAILPGYEYYEPAEGTIVDLNEKGEYILKIKAEYPSGTIDSRIGKQIYQIIRGESEVIDTGEVKNILSNEIKAPFSIDYVKSNDTSRNSTDIYYVKEIIDEIPVYDTYEGDIQGKELYERVFTYPVERAGKYRVKITNYLDEDNKASKETGVFEILSPKQPIITGTEEQYHKILETENSTVILELSADNLENNVRYYWYFAENDTVEPEVISDMENEDNKYEANRAGYYYLKVVNNRNKEDAGVMSEGIRVTLPATIPTSFSYRIGNFEVNITEENNIISAQMPLTIIPQAERADSYLYKWYRADSPTVIIGDSASITPNYPNGTIIYCEVASVYNNNISNYTKTQNFVIG